MSIINTVPLRVATGTPVSPLSPVHSPMTPIYLVNGGTGMGNVVYETVQYLVPVERKADIMQETYVVMDNQPRQQQFFTAAPNFSSSSSTTERVLMQQQEEHTSSATKNVSFSERNTCSQSSSPMRSPVLSPAVSDVNIQSKVYQSSQSSQSSQEPADSFADKLDTRFFGELLAELHRKNTEVYNCISEHVDKIRGRKHHLDSSIDYKEVSEDIESLIPKGVSQLTKQQIRYLLQMRTLSDKSLRLLLTTFSSLKEELIHLQDDLRRLETEKETLERDLAFKVGQAGQYEKLLASVRDNNRQLQQSLKDSSSGNRSLESMILTLRNSDADKDYRVKELECSKRVLEQENDLLRQQVSGQSLSPSFQSKTDEASKLYMEMISNLREEKDKELQALRAQLSSAQQEYSAKSGSDMSLQHRLTELLASLEEKEATIKRQTDEIRRMQTENSESLRQSKSVTRTEVTRRYQTQYPILGLLSDEYQYSAPVKEYKTTVVKRTL
ncbi:protein POF1B [Erpetoichthys calabaricus]|uniref:POF1B actin binding protein n=1 Tax=Erpetoichthys calabaricus TaxID=27687 RepID=A0A8C4XE55_ERPCA|nr:protein POF1B [Erpetoichthys calabaricus]XP_028671805.1 protein POF1B [Erpetoichthys calabaricus]